VGRRDQEGGGEFVDCSRARKDNAEALRAQNCAERSCQGAVIEERSFAALRMTKCFCLDEHMRSPGPRFTLRTWGLRLLISLISDIPCLRPSLQGVDDLFAVEAAVFYEDFARVLTRD
jgi:hypothetical protein